MSRLPLIDYDSHPGYGTVALEPEDGLVERPQHEAPGNVRESHRASILITIDLAPAI